MCRIFPAASEWSEYSECLPFLAVSSPRASRIVRFIPPADTKLPVQFSPENPERVIRNPGSLSFFGVLLRTFVLYFHIAKNQGDRNILCCVINSKIFVEWMCTSYPSVCDIACYLLVYKLMGSYLFTGDIRSTWRTRGTRTEGEPCRLITLLTFSAYKFYLCFRYL